MRHGEIKQASRLVQLVAVTALVVLAGCSEVIRNHGYIPVEEDLQSLTVGVDTRGSVEDLIGKPSSSGVLRGGDWFYVGSKLRHFAYRKPQEINREVIALRFSDDDVLQNVERFGLQDGRVVTLSRRVTETTVRDVTFIRQIIRNFGRIDLGQALGE
ncbi:outer membrane protein assembly factor BamE [Litoreibacter albidus]|uniref:Beta-barrel assembly machine subunit BamE n=1 Tax=Litoreibacter albidus TaxID=670155 RepID=A0A1H2YC62_9RHOB|nr:outer membrane protein assembly factor BamE [Litoreibacter albidus]SDX02813.1 Beta-barrel assembly machine subunit BamE [Litoreibacter albidus]